MMEETDYFSEEVVCMRRLIGTLIGAGLILYGVGTLLSHTLFGDREMNNGRSLRRNNTSRRRIHISSCQRYTPVYRFGEAMRTS